MCEYQSVSFNFICIHLLPIVGKIKKLLYSTFVSPKTVEKCLYHVQRKFKVLANCSIPTTCLFWNCSVHFGALMVVTQPWEILQVFAC